MRKNRMKNCSLRGRPKENGISTAANDAEAGSSMRCTMQTFWNAWIAHRGRMNPDTARIAAQRFREMNQSAGYAAHLFSTEVKRHDGTRAEIAQGEYETAWLWDRCDEKRQSMSRLRRGRVQQKAALHVMRSKAASQVSVPDLSGTAQKLRQLWTGGVRPGKLLPALRRQITGNESIDQD